ncbi:MAG: ParA family protein [Candidatus Hodarchaeales archaeon]|jgi:MinD-like ATPase involved in chromosome partitioning or flagellar assembly
MSNNKDPEVIMVHSYKVGTGKTSVAVNLTQYFAINQSKKVLLIEQDTIGSSFSNIFKLESIKAWNDFYSANLPLKDLIISLDHFDVICARAEDIEIPSGQNPKTFFARQLERLSMQKKWLTSNYDLIILDTQPGYTIELLNSILIADVAVLLTRLDADTVEKTIDMYNRVYSQFKNKRMILIQNQVPTPIDKYSNLGVDSDVEQALQRWHTFVKDKELLTIPLKNEVAFLLSRSRIAPLNSVFMQHIQKIAELVMKNNYSA